MRVILAAPTVAMVMSLPALLLVVEILRLELDRPAVRRAVGRMIPSMLVARKRCRIGHALLSDEALQRIEPVTIISLARVGIARALCALDLLGERGRPLRPGEQSPLVQCERHREGLRLPRLAKHRAVRVARDARHFPRGALCGGSVHQARSRYGSNASMETFSVGSASAPQSSRASNTTV